MWVLAALLLFLQTPDPNAEGMKALDAHNYQAAAQYFGQAVQADPKDYAAHFHLALAYSLLKRDAEGIAEYQKVLELKPGLYEAELNLGVLLVRDQRGQQAVPCLQHTVEAKPKEFRPHFYLAEALLSAGDAAAAAPQFQAALELDPKSAGAELGLARALARQKKLEDAAPHFKRAAELDPGYKDAMLELASLYEADKRAVEAIEIYQQFPGDVAAQERLAGLLIETKRYREAIPLLEQITAKAPTTANRLALGQAYLFAQQLDKALPLLQQSVAAEPANYDLHMMYGRALRDQKQYAPAAGQFAAALKLKPDALEGWKEIAGALYLLGDYQRSLGALDRAHQLGDDSPANYFFHAIMLDKMKQVQPALENYRKFLELSKNQNPDQEFQARQRARILQRELDKR